MPELADALAGWLAAPADLRAATREAIVEATRERYSWDGVARTVIAAAQGDLDGPAGRPAERGARPPPARLGFRADGEENGPGIGAGRLRDRRHGAVRGLRRR